MIGTSFVPVASTLASAVRLGLVSSISVQYSFGKYCWPPFSSSSPLGAKRGHLLGADRQLDHPGVEILDQHPVVLVILGQQAQRVGFDAQVDVFADQDGLALRAAAFWMPKASARMRLSTESVLKTAWPLRAAVGLLKTMRRWPPLGSATPSLSRPGAAETVQHARNRARILAQFGGFAFEPVNFLDDLDGEQDVVFLEA